MKMARKTERTSWKKLLKREKLLQLPAAHDALTAKLIEGAGFKALQIGDFAIAGARCAVPDIDLTRFSEKRAAVREITDATELPVLLDADAGCAGVTNCRHTV